MTVRCGFAQAPRAAEIYEIFQNKEARATLGRVWRGKRGQEIWKLIVTALNAGLLVKNGRAFSTASMLMLFPLAPVIKNYDDLQDPSQLSRVRDLLLPLMIDCRDELLANPERAAETLEEHYEGWKRSILASVTKPPAIETQASVDARAEVSLLSHIPNNVPANINPSIDLLVEEIESRIEKLAHLCGSMDIAYKQRLAERLKESLAKIVSPAPELKTSSNGATAAGS